VSAAFDGVSERAKEAFFDCPEREGEAKREGLNRVLARRDCGRGSGEAGAEV